MNIISKHRIQALILKAKIHLFRFAQSSQKRLYTQTQRTISNKNDGQ